MTKSSRPTFGRLLRSLLATSALVVAAQTASVHAASAAQTLTIESWRNDDADIWTGTIIPAFNAKYPGHQGRVQADAADGIQRRPECAAGRRHAGDLITCRPFDASLDLYKKGNLIAVDDIKGIENFSPVAKSAWQTDDGKTTFCMPMASVIHGFIYNKEIFKELGLTPPKTMAEFHQVIDKIKADGRYTPIDMGTADQWEAATMGFQNIGPNYWHGEAAARR
jgi:ABC-type sugar transport system, periplasmic component